MTQPEQTQPNQSAYSPLHLRRWIDIVRDARVALANIPRAMRLVWQAHPWSTLGMGGLAVLLALLPASQAWVGKLIVDTIVQATQQQFSPQAGLLAVAPWLGVGFLLVTASAALNQGYVLLEHMLNARLSHTINEQIITKALALDLYYFEDSEFYNKLQNARREADFRALEIVNNVFALLQGFIVLATFATLLMVISPPVALILFGATLPAFIAQARYGGLYFRLLTSRAPEFRRMHYLEYLLTVDSTVKEVKLFGLGQPLLKRYQALFWRFYHEDAALARRRSLVSVLWGTLSTASFYGAYAWVVWRTVAGALTLGDLTLYLALFQQSQSTFRNLLGGAGRLYEGGLFLENLFTFLKLEPQTRPGTAGRTLPRPLAGGIEFRGVWFRYPGVQSYALRDVNLVIRPGEKLALVGDNGAGKTTLIKLLARLYEPTEGAILIDGVDVREYDLDDLRQAISIIFQDYVHYQATVRENIGFGQFDAMDDEERMQDAARRGGADDVAARLPSGFDTVLGRWFAEGYELSGGEWQKVALGRAFMRRAEILVLDEPTAALDAEREYAIFQSFHELTAGKTALLISHRFSTVRVADRIAVLKDRTIHEVGTHAELMALNGTYARLFRMQAEGYLAGSGVQVSQ